MAVKMVHLPWDNGILARAKSELTGLALYEGQHESKTVCGSKVRTTYINLDHQEVTCPRCQEVMSNHEAMRARIFESIAKVCVYSPFDYTSLPQEMRIFLDPYYTNALNEKALQQAIVEEVSAQAIAS